jgi:hypothetical protein
MGRVTAGLALALAILAAHPAVAGTRAAYFYHYMDPSHLDRLAEARFDTAVIHWISDTLGVRGTRDLQAFVAKGRATGIEVIPQWILQQPSRLAVSPADRRYTWGRGVMEPDTPCPLDSAYWRSALLDRAEEMFAAAPGIRRIAVDLEFWKGGRVHWDGGACRCRHCVAEYRGKSPAPRDARRLSGLLAWEEAALERRLVPLLRVFAERHPGVEMGFFDLDLDLFAHRAVGRALRRAGVPTADWSERTYGSGRASVPAARARLDALGLKDTPLYGGLWLKRFTPQQLPAAISGVRESADGWWAFTTFSLWLEPAKLTGPYTLPGTQEQYWRALREANTP